MAAPLQLLDIHRSAHRAIPQHPSARRSRPQHIAAHFSTSHFLAVQSYASHFLVAQSYISHFVPDLPSHLQYLSAYLITPGNYYLQLLCVALHCSCCIWPLFHWLWSLRPRSTSYWRLYWIAAVPDIQNRQEQSHLSELYSSKPQDTR